MSELSVTTRGRRLKRRTTAVFAGAVTTLGLVLGTALPANAVGLYYVHSSWIEAAASLSSSTNDGYFQAYARLGDDVRRGAYSPYQTDAYVSGANFTHQAILYRNGSVWKKAQN